jgi:hypothetical protein
VILFLPILARLLPTLAEGLFARGGVGALLGRGAAAEGSGVAEGLAEKAGQSTFKRAAAVPQPKMQPQKSTLSQVVDMFLQREEQRKPPVPTRREAEPHRNYGPSAAEAGFASATPESTIGQARQHFEQKRQESQEKELRESESLAAKSQALGKSLFGLGKKAAGLEFAAFGAAKGLQGFATMVADNRRELGMWNAKISGAFMQLEFGRQQRQIQEAKGTEGSTVSLVNALDDLEREFAPLKRDTVTLLNTAGFIAAKMAQGLVILGKFLPFMVIFRALMEQIEKNTKEEGDAEEPMRTFLGMLKGAAGGAAPPGPLPPPKGPKAPLPPVIPRRP